MIAPELASLALFGGKPAFADPLHVGRPNIGADRKFGASGFRVG